MKEKIVQNINVLSLFDGMSCGQIALDKMGVNVGNYYASEIDKFAIQVTKHNYPNTVHLGDVTKWREWDIDFSSIDLVLAGSPCQGFSFAGHQLAFDDPRSALFFTFVDILDYIKQLNPEVKFLLENVRMKKEHIAVIDDFVGVKSIAINSELVSAQKRNRLYWTNIDVYSLPQDKGIQFRDILETDVDDKYLVSDVQLARLDIGELKECGGISFKSPGKEKSKCDCLLARHYKGMSSMQHYPVVIQNGKLRKLTPVECERLQTVPDNYTACVSNTQRFKMLGNGWTVDVIVHLLRGMFEDIDLFEHYETLPKEVQQLILEFPEDGCMYRNSDKLIEDLEKIGYTCDYDLSGEPYGLKKIEEK